MQQHIDQLAALGLVIGVGASKMFFISKETENTVVAIFTKNDVKSIALVSKRW